MATVAVVLLIGWYHAPAIGDEQPFAPVKVNVEKLITTTPKPDYEAEVLAPLHQKQAEEAHRQALLALAEQRQAQLEAAREVQLSQAPVVQVTGDCSTWMTAAGITDIPDAMWIVTRESGCNPWATNASSGAEGIAQALPYSKTGCAHGDAVCQLIWMQNYVNSRYGGWSGAVAWWKIHNWY